VAPHEASGQIVTRPFTKAGMKERWSAVYNRRDAGPRLILARFADLLRATPPTSSARVETTIPGHWPWMLMETFL
jgi:hypothetical protein